MAQRVLWLLAAVLLCAGVQAQEASGSTGDSVATPPSPAFVQLQWPTASLLQLSLAEPVMLSGTKTFFDTELVTVLDARQDISAAELLFFVGDPVEVSTATATSGLDTTGLATSLAQNLEDAVLDASSWLSAESTSSGGSSNDSAVLWEVATSFHSSDVVCQQLLPDQLVALYPEAPLFAALGAVDLPVSTPFLSFSMVLRNVESPEKLGRSVVYQAEVGVKQFLSEKGTFEVLASGPAVSTTDSALLVSQSFFLLLPETMDASLSSREALANLLLYGDPSRPVIDETAGMNSSRPIMFLDEIFPVEELSVALQSKTVAGSPVFASTLIPYVFRSLSVDTYPDGNPSLPAEVEDDTAVLLAAISEDALQAMRRKEQRFQFDPLGYLASLPANVVYPSNASASSGSGEFSTTIYWANTLAQEFWLERAESVDPVAWNLFPSTVFFTETTATATSSLPAAPLVLLGNASTPLWTLEAATPGQLDVALHLRSTDDNSTLVKVEVAVALHASGDVQSTVTSIARALPGVNTTSKSTSSPLDVVVRHQSRLVKSSSSDNAGDGKASELLLFLELGVASVTEKSADACGHCQQLIEWCGGEPKCAVLQECVFTALQSPIALLGTTAATLNSTEDLWPLFLGCLAPGDTSTAASVDLDALMLFTSGVRCQMQRQCGFRASLLVSDVPPGLSLDSKLVWESGEGHQRLEAIAIGANLPLEGVDTPMNVSIRVGERVLCHLSLWGDTTGQDLESAIAQSCAFAKYLGVLQANASVSSSATESSMIVDLYYKYLTGPLPDLAVDASGVNVEAAVAATVVTVLTPSIRLQLESADDISYYTNASDPVQTEICTECKRLALDVCLRDALCATFADCVLRFPSVSSGSEAVTVETNPLDASTSISSSPLSDAVLELVRRDVEGEGLSLQAAVTSCHPASTTDLTAVDVNSAAWRKLVNASACFSRSACPLVLGPILASSTAMTADSFATVGRWSVSPSQKLQRLIYTGNATSPELVQLPLTLERDGEVVSSSSSVANPEILATTLRSFLEYEDIDVELAGSSNSSLAIGNWNGSNTGDAEPPAWTISYGHWLGALPHFVALEESTDWTLVSYPTISPESGVAVPNDCTLELVSRVASSNETSISNDTSNSSDGTIVDDTTIIGGDGTSSSGSGTNDTITVPGTV